MKIVKLQDDLHNDKLDSFSINVQETVTYGNKAVEYASIEEKAEVEEAVYMYYLQLSSGYLKLCLDQADDVGMLRQTRQKVIDSQEAVNKLFEMDMNYMKKLTNIVSDSYSLKAAVPEEYIETHENVQDKVLDIVHFYVKYCYSLTARMHMHRSSFANETLDAQEENVEKFSKGLSNERKAQIHFDMSGEKKSNSVPQNSSSGCYIATCVYGSYDCPEVWILRRFRDYTLDSIWYGRLFIKCYYAVSPSLVKWFGNQRWFQKFWKNNLDKMVMKLKENGIEDTFYQDKY